MALRDYKPRTDTFLAGEGNNVTVRGLNTQDITILFTAHREDLLTLYTLWQSAEDTPTQASRAHRVLVESITAVPRLVGAVIALASGEDDQTETAMQLPFATQLDAVAKITWLTFDDAGGLGNFFATLAALVHRLGASQTDRPASLTN